MSIATASTTSTALPTSVISSTPSLKSSLAAAMLTATASLAPSSSPTTQADNSSPNQTSGPVIAAAVSVGVALLMLIVVLVAVIIVHRLQSVEKSPGSPRKRAQIDPKIKPTQQLLVLYSWGTSEHDQERIMQCVMNLLVDDTELVYSAKSEVRGDIPQWVEKRVSDCDKVLIVCNKQFSSEWQLPGSTHTEGALVNALRAIITGYINSGEMDKICSKTALVFLKEKHKKLVPSGILHSFKQYMLCEEESETQNELLRFVSDTPLFHFCPQDEDVV